MGNIGIRNTIMNNMPEPSLLGNYDDQIMKFIYDNNLINGCIIDIKKLIELNNIDVIYDKKLGCVKSGYLKHENNKYVIGVNANHSIKQQRFIMAHEFAHYILHAVDERVFMDELCLNNDSIIENAANMFASIILIPEKLIKKYVIPGKTNIEELSCKFKVPFNVMEMRILKLDYKLERY